MEKLEYLTLLTARRLFGKWVTLDKSEINGYYAVVIPHANGEKLPRTLYRPLNNLAEYLDMLELKADNAH